MLHASFVKVVIFLTENNQMTLDSTFVCYKTVRMKILCYNTVVCSTFVSNSVNVPKKCHVEPFILARSNEMF